MLYLADPGESEQEIATIFYNENFLTDEDSDEMYEKYNFLSLYIFPFRNITFM